MRWGDIFEFNAVDLHAPLVGGIVHDLARLILILSREVGLVQVEFTDNISSWFAEFSIASNEFAIVDCSVVLVIWK